jgi:hypothetical protein
MRSKTTVNALATWVMLIAGMLHLSPSTATAQTVPLPPGVVVLTPAAPGSLRATYNSATGNVTIAWVDYAVNETGFRVLREVYTSTGAWIYSTSINTADNITSCTDRPPPGRYRYAVRAYNSRGNSGYSNSVVVDVGTSSGPSPGPISPPPGPEGLPPNVPWDLAAADAGSGSVALTWRDMSDNETEFWLERSPAFNLPNGWMFVSANTTSTGDTPGIGTFQYRIRAVNAVGGSEWTPWVSVTTNGTQPPPPPPNTGFAILTPGTGFTAASAEPAVMGSAGQLGYTARSIARWDVVPYQTVSGAFNVGVVAFHIAGIDRVEFSLNGGPWASTGSMLLNPLTNVWEYVATINTAQLADGRCEVRARVIPRCGVSRVLQDASGQDLGDKSLYLYANHGGSLPNTNRVMWVSPNGSDTVGNGTAALPYWSIRRAITQIATLSGGVTEGATVYLQPGVYTYPDMGTTEGAPSRWFTLEGAPGTSRSQVILTGPGSAPVQKKLRVRNVTLKAIASDSLILQQRSDPFGNHFWVDNCDIEGRGYIGSTVSWQPAVAVSQAVETFYTDVNIRNTAATGFGPHINLIRNVTGENIGADFINSKRMTLNASVNHMRFNSGVHPDIVQVPIGAIENMIIFGLRGTDVTAQGLNIGDAANPMRNVAIVNAVLHKEINDPQQTYLGRGSVTDHLLLWNITSVNYFWSWDTAPRTNFSLRNSVISRKNATDPANYPGAVFDHLHFTDGQYTIGSNVTTGDPGFTNPAGMDFHPRSDSVLVNRIPASFIAVPVTLDGRAVTASQESVSLMGPVGAYNRPQ